MKCPTILAAMLCWAIHAQGQTGQIPPLQPSGYPTSGFGAETQQRQPGQIGAGAGGTTLSPYSTVGGQNRDPLRGSVPTGRANGTLLDLSLDEALARGLRFNLGQIESNIDIRAQRAERLRALAQLLPNIVARPSVSVQQINLAALGFSSSDFPGVPTIVGPFTIYDARAYLSESLSFRNWRNYRAAKQELAGVEYNTRDVREQVTVIITSLYLQAIAESARIEAQQSQVTTAEVAYRQAVDRKTAGTAPAIDVLRAQVQLESERQRLIFEEGQFERYKLDLARAIGLAPGQEFRLTDSPGYTPLPPDVTLESTLTRAYHQRFDHRAAEWLLRSAETAKSAAKAGRYPSFAFNADYGVIGPRLTQSHGTFTVIGGIEIPIFQGGRVKADVELADALVRRRRAELEDIRGRIDADVRAAFIDLRSASRRVEVAVLNVDLAKQALQQSQDRFTAGVTNNLEVVQAQQSVAQANDDYISSLYSFNLAKAALARARGDAERTVQDLLK